VSTEIERKFLVHERLLPALPAPDSIEQGYLSSKPTVRVRLRTAPDGTRSGFLTIKGPGLLTRAEFEYAIPPEDAVLLLALCAGVGLLIRELLGQRESAAREGLAIIGLGTLASVLPFVALYLLPAVLGRQQVLPPEMAVLPLVLMPASFAYAILRRDALHVPLVQRWLVHGVLWAVLIAAYTAPIFLLRQITRTLLPEPARSTVLAAALVALIAGSFRWIHDRLWQRLDRRIFKDRYDYPASLQGLSRDLSQAGDLASLGTTLAETLR